MKSCCFTGHRNIPIKDLATLQHNIRDILTQLIEKGVTDFYCGGALGFDTLCANYVIELKKKGADIRLYIVIPHRKQHIHWKPEEIKMYEEIARQSTDCITLSHEYYNGCMKTRNQYLVDHADVCVAYLTDSKSGTGQTVRMSEKKGIIIIDVLHNKYKE